MDFNEFKIYNVVPTLMRRDIQCIRIQSPLNVDK